MFIGVLCGERATRVGPAPIAPRILQADITVAANRLC